PVMILNAAVAEAIGDLTEKVRAAMKNTKSRDDAVLAVVRESFKWSTPVRFEGNNYSDEWVKEAAKRGLPNYRRSPDALDQLVTDSSRKLFTGLGVLTNEELNSRYHIRLERYSKDILIELSALREVVDTMILPAAFAYSGSLAQSAAHAKTGGIEVIPQVDAANDVGRMIQRLVAGRNALSDAIDDANGLHDDPRKQAGFLTSEGARCTAAVREVCDELELSIGDEYWPLPKYREMLFPV
ncbi:MAG: glutamine synthetase type III, partial [Gemmatimonadaceae bacterium]